MRADELLSEAPAFYRRLRDRCAAVGIDVGHQPLPDPTTLDAGDATSRALLHVAVLLARTLEDQFDVENALFCSCATDLTRQAGEGFAWRQNLTGHMRWLSVLDGSLSVAGLGPPVRDHGPPFAG